MENRRCARGQPSPVQPARRLGREQAEQRDGERTERDHRGERPPLVLAATVGAKSYKQSADDEANLEGNAGARFVRRQ